MPRDPGRHAFIGWLKAYETDDDLAGAAFLVAPSIALTCTHVVRDHLGLGVQTPAVRPDASITIRLAALGTEVSGHVIEGGWFPDSLRKAYGLSDIAVIRLDQAVTGISTPAIARQMPTVEHNTFVFGAKAGYQSMGQTAKALFQPANHLGWLQLDLASSATGYTVKRGFSGAPALDDLGNTVWGMIVAVEDEGGNVAFAISADDLREALREAGVVADIRVSDNLDASSRAAMLEQAARQTPADSTAHDALDALEQGNPKPVTEALRERIDRQKQAGRAANADAAEASRQLGALLSLTDTVAALAAYREAAELDPAHARTLIEIGRLEQRTGSLARAAEALTQAIRASAQTDERTLGTAWTDLGDVRVAQGDLAAALEAYQKGLDIATRLVAGDAHNSQWQRDLSISHNKIGDVRVAQGDLAAALEAFQKGLGIRTRLAAGDAQNSQWQRDLFVSHTRIGDVRVAQGDLAAALEAFQQGLDIATRLAELDPSNAQWQEDLIFVRDRIARLGRPG